MIFTKFLSFLSLATIAIGKEQETDYESRSLALRCVFIDGLDFWDFRGLEQE